MVQILPPKDYNSPSSETDDSKFTQPASSESTTISRSHRVLPQGKTNRPRVELCGMRGGIDRPVGVAGGIVRGETDHPLAVEFTEAEPFTRCERCTTEMVCYWLEQCAYAERIATEGLVR